MLHKLRRYPPLVLRGIPLVGQRLSNWYQRADINGKLSDIIADPQLLYEKVWPYRFIRKHFGWSFTPCVSVVLATRNNESTIGAAINSILRQSMPPLEVIVIDDASDDGSVAIIRAIAEKDPRLKVIENETHLGTGASRNLGLKIARGHYIAFQDGDDVSAPSRLEMQYNAFTRFPDKKVVLCNYVRTNESGQAIRINDRRTMKCIISMMFPREEIINKVGYFRDETVSEDSDYYQRIKGAFGKNCEAVVFRTLYRALFRPTSAFFTTASITQYDGSTLLFERRADALAHWEVLSGDHQQMAAGLKPVYVPFHSHSVGNADGQK